MNRYRRNREVKEGQKEGKLTQYNYVVSRQDLIKAYTLYCKGYKEELIAIELGITFDCFIYYRVRFREYFKRRDEVDFKVIPLERNVEGTFRGKNKKYHYKINPSTVDLNFIHDLSLAGYSQEKICKLMGVSPLTFIHYKEKNPAIQETLDNARARKDLDVLLALHSAATGYNYNKIYLTSYKGKVIEKEYTKLKHPNIHAAINWLINSPNIDWSGIKEGTVNTDKGDILRFLDHQNNIKDRKEINNTYHKNIEENEEENE